MTDDALAVVSCIFSNLWRLFNSWYIPGTNVTPAVMLFGSLFLVILFRFLSNALGLFSSAESRDFRTGGKIPFWRDGDRR